MESYLEKKTVSIGRGAAAAGDKTEIRGVSKLVQGDKKVRDGNGNQGGAVLLNHSTENGSLCQVLVF